MFVGRMVNVVQDNPINGALNSYNRRERSLSVLLAQHHRAQLAVLIGLARLECTAVNHRDAGLEAACTR